MKYFWKFHDWYDEQAEPKRFLLMLLLVFPAITPNIWVTSPALLLVWAGYLLVLLGPRMWRHYVVLPCNSGCEHDIEGLRSQARSPSSQRQVLLTVVKNKDS